MSLSGPGRRRLPSCRALQGAEYQLRLSLFDATYHHFFGRTWRSSRRAARAAPQHPARVAFNEVGCGGTDGGWVSGRTGWVWENADSLLGWGGTRRGGGSDPAGRRLGRQEPSPSGEAFNARREKTSLFEFSLEPLSFGAGLLCQSGGSGARRALVAHDQHAVAMRLLKQQALSVPGLWPAVGWSVCC